MILVGWLIDYQWIKKLSFISYVFGIICILALLSPLGVEANHAKRWLNVGISVQVAEIVKITLIVWMAMFADKFSKFFRVSIKCKDLFGSVIVTGVLLQIAIQVLINVSVCLNLIPNTGISLPFISYGGTSLVLILLEMGMVVSVYRNIY